MMRRRDKEIRDIEEIESIIRKALVCRLGLSDDNNPYIIPVNFGYENGSLYIHSAQTGKKLEILKKNNNVCFEFDIDHEFVMGAPPCKSTMKFKSVVGNGKAMFIENLELKKYALKIITNQYIKNNSFEFQEDLVQKMTIMKIDIKSMTGKKSVN